MALAPSDEADAAGITVPGISAENTIGADFDWSAIQADTNYQITGEVTANSDVNVTIPETTAIYIMNGGSLMIEDATFAIDGSIFVMDGGTIILSSMQITFGGQISVEAGAIVSLQSGTAYFDTATYGYNAIAGDNPGKNIIVLDSGVADFTQMQRDPSDSGTVYYDVDLDGVARIVDEEGFLASYYGDFDITTSADSSLTISSDYNCCGPITNNGTVTIDKDITVNVEGSFSSENGDVLIINHGTVINNGTIQFTKMSAENYGTVQNNGAISISDGSTFTVKAGGSITGE